MKKLSFESMFCYLVYMLIFLAVILYPALPCML